MTAPETEILSRFPGVTFATARAALAREAEARLVADAEKIAKGRSSQAEAAERQQILAALAEDLDRVRAAWPSLPTATNGAPPPRHNYTWRERDRTLLALRTAEDSPELAAIHALYEDGLDWPADPEIRMALTFGVMHRRNPNWIDRTATPPATADWCRTHLTRAAELGIIAPVQEELAV